ncbi:hypothetical protein K1719_044950 [Acacia pycnantha]|nr:hypothetical protein K1719_044950 [Acacia pycnantha]
MSMSLLQQRTLTKPSISVELLLKSSVPISYLSMGFISAAHVHVFLNNIKSNQEKEEETCSNHTEGELI